MAFTGSFVCTSYKVDLLVGRHNFTTGTGHTFKMALYDSTATLTGATTAYTASGEIAATGYTATGQDLVIAASSPASDATVAWVDFEDATWTGDSITAYGALVYNDSLAGKNAVVVLDFLGPRSSEDGIFSLPFPINDANNAIIRIG